MDRHHDIYKEHVIPTTDLQDKIIVPCRIIGISFLDEHFREVFLPVEAGYYRIQFDSFPGSKLWLKEGEFRRLLKSYNARHPKELIGKSALSVHYDEADEGPAPIAIVPK